jgi:hypothetical protein
LFPCSFEIYLQNLHNVKEREEERGDECRQTNERAGKVIREKRRKEARCERDDGGKRI